MFAALNAKIEAQFKQLTEMIQMPAEERPEGEADEAGIPVEVTSVLDEIIEKVLISSDGSDGGVSEGMYSSLGEPSAMDLEPHEAVIPEGGVEGAEPTCENGGERVADGESSPACDRGVVTDGALLDSSSPPALPGEDVNSTHGGAAAEVIAGEGSSGDGGGGGGGDRDGDEGGGGGGDDDGGGGGGGGADSPTVPP